MVRAKPTSPNSDGVRRRARIATESKTSTRPPTYDPYAQKMPRSVRTPTPWVTLPAGSSL